jgi:hypothetical protein
VSRLSTAIILACAGSLNAGCASHDCTAIGVTCGQTLIALQSPNDAWTAGTYTLVLTMDGAPGLCTMQVPDPPPPSGVQGSCGLGATSALSLVTVDSCPPVVCNNGACGGMSCTPIPGHFRMMFTINPSVSGSSAASLPAKVGMNLTVDGKQILNQTVMPMSATTEPNGTGCGTCTNASATVAVMGG